MNCPRCKKEYEDFDGVGVVYCDPKVGGCGFCRHVARSGGVCDLCGDKEQPKISDICPACSNSTDVSEGGAGEELNCTSCGAFLVIEEYTDGTFGLEPADSEEAIDP